MSNKRARWSNDEIAIVEDAVEQSKNTPVKDLINDISETLGRSEQSVRNRFYRTKQGLEEGSAPKFDRRYKPNKSSSNDQPIYQTLDDLNSDLEDLKDDIHSLQQNIQEARNKAKTIEDWVESTINLRKKLSYTVDHSGVVEKISKASNL